MSKIRNKNLFEQKLRQIILVRFYFPLSAIISLSRHLSLLFLLHMKPHSLFLHQFPLAHLLPLHLLPSLQILSLFSASLFLLCSLLSFSLFSPRSFGPLLSPSSRDKRKSSEIFLQEDTNAKALGSS